MDPLSQLSITVGGLDLAIIAAYLVVVFLAGILLTRMASTDIDSYFLGGHSMPWWLLGVSGTSAYFDVSGVMWTIAFFLSIGVAALVAASLLTPPTEINKLVDFYRRIRLPGTWGPVKEMALAENPNMPFDSFGRDLACLFMIMFGLHNLYSGSCHACTKVWSSFAMNVVNVALSAYVLYYLWYKNLPDKNEGVSPDPNGNERDAATLDGERPLRQAESMPS